MEKTITIATAGSRYSKKWQNIEMPWEEFKRRLQGPPRGMETLGEYKALPRQEQDELKDQGGYVGGALRDGLRRRGHMDERTIGVLDLDHCSTVSASNIITRIANRDIACVIHSTRKHCPNAPRLRVIIPFAAPVKMDEYEPIMRKAAELMGLLDMADTTCYEPERLMFWPTLCRDSEYICIDIDGQYLDPQAMLGLYDDWRDISKWPYGENEKKAVAKGYTGKTPQDPTTKEGAIGAFCKAYSVEAAIETFLDGIYEPGSIEGRYTYIAGSTANGVAIFDSKFAKSWHATDPANTGHLLNAFDLVRIHLFGGLDEDAKEGAAATSLPSYKAMCEFAINNDAVQDLLQAEFRAAGRAFEKIETKEDYVFDADKNGKILNTIENAERVIKFYPDIDGQIRLNQLREVIELKDMPWHTEHGWQGLTTGDYFSFYKFFESEKIPCKRITIDAAIDTVARSKPYDAIKVYFANLPAWDGITRLEIFFIDYLGADDTTLTREFTKKALVACATRALSPGAIFDNVVILIGAQGVGKSTAIRKLSPYPEWHSDALFSFEGIKAYEALRGRWIIEVAELNAFDRATAAAFKSFISSPVDHYRPAYAKTVEDHPRRCVLFGTTNEPVFLKDDTGNRRFWPVQCYKECAKKSIWDNFTDAERDQLWAEAKQLYMEQYPLHLSREMEDAARELQSEHHEADSWETAIEEFLERPIAENWYDMTFEAQRLWLNTADPLLEGVGRKDVCTMEIWRHLFQDYGKPAYPNKSDSIRIANTLNKFGWKKTLQITTAAYGRPRIFKRTTYN